MRLRVDEAGKRRDVDELRASGFRLVGGVSGGEPSVSVGGAEQGGDLRSRIQLIGDGGVIEAIAEGDATAGGEAAPVDACGGRFDGAGEQSFAVGGDRCQRDGEGGFEAAHRQDGLGAGELGEIVLGGVPQAGAAVVILAGLLHHRVDGDVGERRREIAVADDDAGGVDRRSAAGGFAEESPDEAIGEVPHRRDFELAGPLDDGGAQFFEKAAGALGDRRAIDAIDDPFDAGVFEQFVDRRQLRQVGFEFHGESCGARNAGNWLPDIMFLADDRRLLAAGE